MHQYKVEKHSYRADNHRDPISPMWFTSAMIKNPKIILGTVDWITIKIYSFVPCAIVDIFLKISYLFIYLRFYVAVNTVQVISRWVVGKAEETSAYSSSGFCTVNCRPTASNYQLSHLRPSREPNPSLRGGRRECYHSATVAPLKISYKNFL